MKDILSILQSIENKLFDSIAQPADFIQMKSREHALSVIVEVDENHFDDVFDSINEDFVSGAAAFAQYLKLKLEKGIPSGDLINDCEAVIKMINKN